MAKSKKPIVTADGLGQAGRSLSQRVFIDQAGRVVVPAPIRKALGIRGRQVLHISLVDGGTRLQTIEAGASQARALLTSLSPNAEPAKE